MKTPRFKGYKYSNNPDLKAHAAITRQSSTEGMVLLKNDATLPIKDLKTVALFGVNSYDFLSGGLGSGGGQRGLFCGYGDIVKNTGKVSGKQVAEVYVTDPKGAYEKPAKELKTFGKTRELKPGESQTLKMTLEKRDLAGFDEANSQWKVDAGNYIFKLGADVENIKGSVTLKVGCPI